jgi:[FeFe] hydrogenase H-cluster maturation GTPase HydF
MFKTPKSLRLQIGLFGRTNVGKSTFLNYITNQEVSITSPVPGTTTDVVEKAMELLPVGPVLFLDTAGLDDTSELSSLRLMKTGNIFERSDVYVLVVEPGIWGIYENKITGEARKNNTPLIVAVNKCDVSYPSKKFLGKVKKYTDNLILVSSTDHKGQDKAKHMFKSELLSVLPRDFLAPPPIIGDLMGVNGLAVLIVPVDKEAPKGRIILPQVQTIRDALDHGQMSLVVTENEYLQALGRLKKDPDIVVCDSQVVDKMVQMTPERVKSTTFSILFARIKGDLGWMAESAFVINSLQDGDKVLISESCTHHPVEDDIGRVKIPQWMKKYTGKDIIFDHVSGRDFPENLSEYKLIIQCGGCMQTRREILSRIEKAKMFDVPITNYGVCISFLQDVLEKVLSPFPGVLNRYMRITREGVIEK